MNKPSFTNLVCIAGDLGTSVAVIEALFARDADVRTLDEMWEPDLFGVYRYTVFIRGGEPRTFTGEGATPDEARAKAAAWVREQKEGT